MIRGSTDPRKPGQRPSVPSILTPMEWVTASICGVFAALLFLLGRVDGFDKYYPAGEADNRTIGNVGLFAT